MINCVSCSKVIKTKGKWFRQCKNCKGAVCLKCNIEGFCRACHPANADQALIDEYREEKYAEKMTP